MSWDFSRNTVKCSKMWEPILSGGSCSLGHYSPSCFWLNWLWRFSNIISSFRFCFRFLQFWLESSFGVMLATQGVLNTWHSPTFMELVHSLVPASTSAGIVMSAAVTGRVSFSRRFLLQSLRDEFHSLEMFFSCEFRFFWFGGAVGVAFCFCGAYPNPSLKGRSLPHPLPKGKGFDAAMRDGGEGLNKVWTGFVQWLFNGCSMAGEEDCLIVESLLDSLSFCLLVSLTLWL